MVRIIFVFALIIFWLMVALPILGETLELTLAIELGAGDLLPGSDFELYILPSIDTVIGDTGFGFGLSWEVPLLLTVDVGTIELYEEYSFSAGEFELEVGNDNALDLGTGDFEGYLYSILGHDLYEFWFEVELDYGYTPTFSIDSILSLTYEYNLSKLSILGAGVSLNLALYQQLGLGDTEFYLSYTYLIRDIEIIFELNPILTTGANTVELGMYTLIAFKYYL
jgi:hypothetical protein